MLDSPRAPSRGSQRFDAFQYDGASGTERPHLADALAATASPRRVRDSACWHTGLG
jgi:hypothetical protein